MLIYSKSTITFINFFTERSYGEIFKIHFISTNEAFASPKQTNVYRHFDRLMNREIHFHGRTSSSFMIKEQCKMIKHSSKTNMSQRF